MNAARENSAGFMPTQTVLFAPVLSMADYVPQSHPVVAHLRVATGLTAASLEAIAIAEWTPILAGIPTEDVKDCLLVTVESLRLSESFIAGKIFDLLLRDVALHVPDLEERLRTAREGAIYNLRQLRACLAVLSDGDHADDEGVEVLPKVPRAKPGPSVDFQW